MTQLFSSARNSLETVLFDQFHADTGRRTRVILTEDGAIIVNDQERAAILRDNARQRAMFDKWNAYKANVSDDDGQVMIHVARIPMADYWNLVRAGITRNPAQLRAWLNRGDTRAFRVDDCRRL
jgi:hypothetical protein